MLEFCTYSEPIARKGHKCFLCGEEIHAGEKHIRFSGKCDGMMFDHRFHPLCSWMIEKYCRANDKTEYTEDSVIEWVEETVCYNCEHGWHGGGKYGCETSIFHCQKVIDRISGKEGAD